MLDIFQFHHPVREEFQRPALTSIGSLATRQMNQSGFSLPIQAAAFGTFAREASRQSHLQILLDKPLFDANDRAATDRERLGNLPIVCLWFALTLIAHQKNSGHQIVLGWSPARVDHRLQPSALLLAQFHEIAVVRGSHTAAPLFCFSLVVSFSYRYHRHFPTNSRRFLVSPRRLFRAWLLS
jgi:hypothetical protein